MPDRNEDHGRHNATCRHHIHVFMSQLTAKIIHSTFQVNSSSCSFVWLLGFAATFVTVTLRKEIKFSFGVCALLMGAGVGLGGLEEDTAAPAGL